MQITSFVSALKDHGVGLRITAGQLTITGREKLTTNKQLTLLACRPEIFAFLREGSDRSLSMHQIAVRLERDWHLIPLDDAFGAKWTAANGDEGLEAVLAEQLDPPWRPADVVDDRPSFFRTATGWLYRIGRYDRRTPVFRGDYRPDDAPSSIDFNPPATNSRERHPAAKRRA